VDTLLHFGLSNALMATALALPAALISRFCQRPALAHGLWLLVVLKLLTPPLFAVPVLWLSPPALRTTSAAATSRRSADRECIDSGGTRSPLATGSVVPEPSKPVLTESAASSLPLRATAPAAAVSQQPHWAWAVGLAWGAGSVLWLASLGWRVCRFQRLLGTVRRCPPRVQERARWLAQRLGLAQCPTVWFMPGCVSPLLWALVGPPRLLLPDGLWNQLSNAQQDTLLAHELAHLRRRDHWVRWLELAAVGLYWWHPVAWWAQRELQETEEQCCDAWVVAVLPASADAYAEALLETVTYLSQAPATVPVGGSGAGRVHLLKRRLIMILNGTTPKTMSPAGRWLVLALGAVLLPVLPTWVYSQASRGSETTRPESADLAAGPEEDEGREKQISQARAAVRELTSEMDRMQAHLSALAGRLEAAQARLARLEGHSEPPRASGVSERALNALGKTAPRDPSKHDQPDIGKAPPATKEEWGRTPPAPDLVPYGTRANTPQNQSGNRGADLLGLASRSNKLEGREYDQRLKEVEGKLDRLLEEFKILRQRQPSRPSDLRKN
jgi:bla regulator protein BlaR1